MANKNEMAKIGQRFKNQANRLKKQEEIAKKQEETTTTLRREIQELNHNVKVHSTENPSEYFENIHAAQDITIENGTLKLIEGSIAAHGSISSAIGNIRTAHGNLVTGHGNVISEQGYVAGRSMGINVVDDLIISSVSGAVYHNLSSAKDVSLTLPSVNSSDLLVSYKVIVASAHKITLMPSVDSCVCINGVMKSAGVGIESTAIGSVAEITSIGKNWFVIGANWA